MTEYIITEEQVNEIAKSLPLFYVPTWLYKWTYKQKVFDGAYEIGRCKVGVKLPKIVRCRDCKYATKRWTPAHREEVTYCERFVHLAGYNQSAYVEPDGFCAWGERRES